MVNNVDNEFAFRKNNSNMKKACMMMAAGCLFTACAIAQTATHEKNEMRHDVIREHDKNAASVQHALAGQPARARQDHREAAAAHRAAAREGHELHQRRAARDRRVVRHHRRVSRHHYRRHR